MTNRKPRRRYQPPDPAATAIARARLLCGGDDVQVLTRELGEQLLAQGQVDEEQLATTRALAGPRDTVFYCPGRGTLFIV